MPEESVKLMRSPTDTDCADCEAEIPFGAWAFINTQTKVSICPECGVKRGWSSKHRADQLIKDLEIREDIKALRNEKKILLDGLALLEAKIDLHRLGERDVDLEQQIVTLMQTIQDYLHHAGTPKEKEALDRVFEAIRENQDLQKEVREHVQARLFRVQKKEAKQKEKEQAALV